MAEKTSPEKTFLLLLQSLSLKNLPRAGWLRTKARRESVAEHTFGMAIFALVLARMEKLGEKEEALLLRRALLHDLHEAVIGDLTPRQKKKEKPDEAGVERQMLSGTLLEREIPLLQGRKLATLMHDADKLDMLFRALENAKAGNKNMAQFVRSAMGQIKTKSGKRLAALALVGERKHRSAIGTLR